MRGAKRIKLALAADREAADPPQLAKGRHAVAPAGQNFVWIGLMPDIPNHAVIRRVEHVMERDG